LTSEMHIALVRAESREGLIAQVREVLNQLERGTKYLEAEHVLNATAFIHSGWPVWFCDPSQQRLVATLEAMRAHFTG